MCRRLIYLVSLVFVLSLAANASADLILHWPFNDGSGTTAVDASGNGRNGTLEGNPKWVAGKIGGALDFGGDGDRVVDENGASYLNGLDAMTITVWIKSRVISTEAGFIEGEDPDTNDNVCTIRYDAAGASYGGSNLLKMAVTSSGEQQLESSSNLQTTEWQHVAMTWSSGDIIRLYIDGVEDTPSGNASPASGPQSGVVKFIVGQGGKDTAGGWNGLIDDVRIYNEVLSAERIQGIMIGEGYPYALGPSPEDGAMYPDTWATISWSPGDFAVSHDVYMGENFDDVNEGTSDTFQGNQASTFFVIGFPGFLYPDGLVPGTTYYWRIDEVNEADPNSPWKGNVWSFTVPPKTAYGPVPADGSELVDLDVKLRWTAGFGAKLHYVYFGEDFDEVNNATVGVPQGSAAYTPGTLKLAKTYYWRVDEFDAAATHKGEVWSFTTEGAVSGPNPANGAVDVKPSVILRWDAGTVAASHEVYFGTDADIVKNATKSSPEYKGPKALGEESYDPGKLILNTAYYWRIDEVNGVNPDSPWAGNVWSFTTGDFFSIDDFEDYDTGVNQIWYAWHDGLGYGTPGTADYFAGNGTGAAVGDETTASYTEETIVHGGGKSMPVAYDNNKQGYAYYSEVEYTLTAQRDWTEKGVAELSLWFHGDSANAAEPLYVAIANAGGALAVVVYEDPAAAMIDIWTPWVIPLQAFADQGINLTNVDRIAIGLGTKGNMTVPGGSGKMYFDDIRLNQPSIAE